MGRVVNKSHFTCGNTCNCQALCPFLCLCVYVSKNLRKWTQTDTKVTFHPTHHPPPGNFFWSQMKGMAKIKLFYSSAMALILPRLKDIAHFVFLWLYIRTQRFCLRYRILNPLPHNKPFYSEKFCLAQPAKIKNTLLFRGRGGRIWRNDGWTHHRWIKSSF